MKREWIYIMIVIIGDFCFPYILAPFYKGYRHSKRLIDDLGSFESPVKKYYIITQLCLGFLWFLAAIFIFQGYFHSFPKPTLYLMSCMAILVESKLMANMFLIIMYIMESIFLSEEGKQRINWLAMWHRLLSTVGLIGAALTPLSWSLLDFCQGNIIDGNFFIVCFIGSIGSLCLFFSSGKSKFIGTIFAEKGLWQRAVLFFMYIPFLYMGISSLIA